MLLYQFRPSSLKQFLLHYFYCIFISFHLFLNLFLYNSSLHISPLPSIFLYLHIYFLFFISLLSLILSICTGSSYLPSLAFSQFFISYLIYLLICVSLILFLSFHSYYFPLYVFLFIYTSFPFIFPFILLLFSLRR